MSNFLSSHLAWPIVHHLNLPTPSGHLKARILLPPEYDLSEVVTYPLLLSLSEDPEEQLVTDAWSLDFVHALASSLKVAVLQVDGRGTSGKGEKWQRQIFGRIGDIDVEDHYLAVRLVV